MGVYYTFYDATNMKKLEDGKFAGMPFDMNNCPPVMEVSDDNLNYFRTGIMNRKMAEAFQEIMPCNKTFFTDLMDENGTDTLIYRIT